MPFQLTYTKTLSSDKKYLTLQDTADWDVEGAPNRETTWVYFFVSKLVSPSPSLEDCSIVNSYDGLDSDSTATFELKGSGIYRIDVLALSTVALSGTYAAGSIYYDTVTETITKAVTANTLTGAITTVKASEVFTDPQPLTEGNASEHYPHIYSLNVFNARQCLATICEDCKEDISREQDFQKYLKVFHRIEGIKNAYILGEYYRATKIIESLVKITGVS